MAQSTSSIPNEDTGPARISEYRRFIRVFFSRTLVKIGVVLLGIFILVAVFGPIFTPYDPNAQNLKQVLQAPSTEHFFGTDYNGRDTFSRLIYGSRMSLAVGIVAVGIAAVIGMTAGLIAGFYGAWANAIIMRIVDTLMSFPMILLALVISGLLGGGLLNVMIALGVAMIPAYARLMCGLVLSLKESDYVLAGQSIGDSSFRLMFRHILPNSFPPLIVLITMQIGSAILAEAGLSYLGIGITPPTPSWGAMVNDGFKYILTHPLLSFIPGVAIMLVVFAFNMVGDGLRDALDPRLRGTL